MKKLFLLVAVIVSLAVDALAREAYYTEFKITSAAVTGTSKTYSSSGDCRMEMVMSRVGMAEPMRTGSLMLAATPGKIYGLNDNSKTYTEMDASASSEHRDEDDYEITVLGREKINDYNCVHVKVKNKRSQRTSDMWLSKDVKGYAGFTEVKTSYFGGSKFYRTLKDKGAEGCVVRMLSAGERGAGMQLDLVKAEKLNVPASMFSLDGYTKGAARTPGNGAVDMQAIQKMTPEERQKYLEQMKERYRQQAPQEHH